MKYCFNVNLTDKDYFEFNKFIAIKSPYNKKQLVTLRLIFPIFFILCIVLLFINDEYSSKERLVSTIIYLILAVIAEIITPSIFTLFLKQNLRFQKKAGKAGYSASSQIEFYDDYFTEMTADGKTENKYSALERISIVDGYVYIHINGLMCYILPKSVFTSEKQYEEFIGFITSKCNVVDKY